MAVRILIIFCVLFLVYFLVVELLAARKWKRLVKYAGKWGFSDENYEKIVKRDRDIAKKNKLFQFDWFHPTRDMRKVRKLGFIRIPVHIHAGLAEELWQHTSPFYRGRILGIEAFDEGWKDKYNTPRFETNPHIYITLFGVFGINIIWGFKYDINAPDEERYDVDKYWEQALWCLYYCDGDLEKARETWPWRDMKEESTWDEKYVRNKFRKNGDNR